MPKAIAPNAPCVLVCESPQAIVVPGWVMPCSGPTMWTMPCLPGRAVEEGDAELRAALAQRLDHRLGQRIAVGLGHLVGRHDVVHRGERAVRHQRP
jgi:hypothetical protein